MELSDLPDIDIIRPDPNNFREFDDYWEKIRQQITNIVRADAREAAIERIDYAQTRAGEPMSLPEHVLKPSNSTDNALINYYPGKNYIDEFGLQADGEVFHKLRAGFLRELACDQRSYPEVAFSVVLMSIGLYVESDDRGGTQHYLELGRQLLDEPCPTGGMIDISPEERALFEERLAEHETESAD